MFCDNCRLQIDDDSRFCEYCGVGVALSAPQQEAAKVNQTVSCQQAHTNRPLSSASFTANIRNQSGNKTQKVVLIAAAALFAVIIMATAAFYFFNPGFKESIQNISFFKGDDRKKLSKALLKYDEFTTFSEGLAGVKKNDKWGFINQTGNEVIPCVYDEIENSDFIMSVNVIVRKNGKYGLINQTGKELIPFGKYEERIDRMYNGLLSVGGRILDENGKENPDFQVNNYDVRFHDGINIIKSSGKFVLENKEGQEIVLQKPYSAVLNFSDGMAAVQMNGVVSESSSMPEKGTWGFIDKTGKEAIPCIYTFQYNNVRDFREGLVQVMKNGKYGYIDKTGKTIVPFKYSVDCLNGMDDFNFSDGFARVIMKNKGGVCKWGLVDNKGKEAIPCIYDYIGPFSEGFAAVEIHGKYGIINIDGKIVIPANYCKIIPQHAADRQDFYRMIPSFRNGLVKLILGNCKNNDECKYGVIDQSNNVVIPFIYDYIYSDTNDYFICGKNNKQGLLDNTGKEISPFIYDHIYPKYNYFVCEINHKQGLLDNTGKEIITPVFDEIYIKQNLNNTANINVLIKAKWNNITGYIDEQGYFISAGAVYSPSDLVVDR